MSKRKLLGGGEGSPCIPAKVDKPEPVIEVSVNVTRGLEQKNAWRYGKFIYWKPISGGQRIPIYHLMSHRFPKITWVSEKVEHFLEVYRSLSYSEEQQIWIAREPIEERPWTRIQRTCQDAFTGHFYNSAGRNFIDALLKYYIKDEALDICNIGGSSPHNPKLKTLNILYDFYAEDSDGSSSSEESPKKSSPQKESPQKDTSFSSSPQSAESDGIVHTPVVDNLIYHNRSKRGLFVVSVKHGRSIRKEHTEQLKLVSSGTVKNSYVIPYVMFRFILFRYGVNIFCQI